MTLIFILLVLVDDTYLQERLITIANNYVSSIYIGRTSDVYSSVTADI